jgi:hypothetical protein
VDDRRKGQDTSDDRSGLYRSGKRSRTNTWQTHHRLGNQSHTDSASASKVAQWARTHHSACSPWHCTNRSQKKEPVCSTGRCLLEGYLFRDEHHLIAHIEDVMFLKWRQENPAKHGEKETVAYDMTTVMAYSEICPLVERGCNAKKKQ